MLGFLIVQSSVSGLAAQGAAFLLMMLIIGIIAYGAWYLISTFAPAGLQKPLYAVGVILGLILILYFLGGGFGTGFPRFR